MDVRIRRQTAEETSAVLEVEREAFERPEEAQLVERLLADVPEVISIVAILDGSVVGHVLFSPAYLKSHAATVQIGALGPVAVQKDVRRCGVGARLIEFGLGECWNAGWPAVIVLGAPAYYSRFGFARADGYGIRCALDVPAEAFLVLSRSLLLGGSTVAEYHPAFGEV